MWKYDIVRKTIIFINYKTNAGKNVMLLPDLEGVDSVAQQVAIAKQKAGIRVDDYDVQLERFEVIRHEAS